MRPESSPPGPSADGLNGNTVKPRTAAAVGVIAGIAPPNNGITTAEIKSSEARDEEDCALPDQADDVHAPIDASLALDMTVVTRNLWLFIWLKTIGSHDSGAFSAAIAASDGIAENWGLSYSRQGTLTSSVFLGNIIGCPLAGQLFSSYSEKSVLTWSLVIHTVFTFLFALFSNYYVALVNRFFIGLTLAFIVVYTPVWVDEFAPKDRQSVWMASHNAGVPLGIMMGYLLAAFFPTYTSIGWEWAFYIKCVLMVPTIAYVVKVDKRTINTRKKEAQPGMAEMADHESDGSPANAHDDKIGGASSGAVGSHAGVTGTLNKWWAKTVDATRTLWRALKPIMSNVIFMCSVLAMSSLYFVATGLQNFVTQYLLEEPFNASMRTIMAGFGASVVTAPVCGVVVGGILLDRIGGYQRNLFRVSLFACAWGFAASIAAIICIFVTTTTGFLLVMSVVLFCGGAIIPPGLGLTMSTLPPHLRSMAAAFSQTLYNLLGNFSGPLICGQVAEWTGELKYGIMVLLLSSILGLIPMAVIFFIAWRARRASGATLDLPDAVAVVAINDDDEARGGDGSSLSAANRDTVAHIIANRPMQNESFVKSSGFGNDDDEPLDLHRGRPVSNTSPYPPTYATPVVNMTPPGHAQLSDVQSARWQRATVTSSTTTTRSGAHFSPLRSNAAADDGTAVAPAAGEGGAPMAESEVTRMRQSENESLPGSAVARAGDLEDESSHVLQAMPTPYLFGMDVVRTLLHPQQMPSTVSEAGSHSVTSRVRRARSEVSVTSGGGESPADPHIPAETPP